MAFTSAREMFRRGLLDMIKDATCWRIKFLASSVVCVFEIVASSEAIISTVSLVEPEEVDDSLFPSSCGGWPLALRPSENWLEQPDPSVEGDLLQPEVGVATTLEGDNETEIETPKTKFNALTMRRTQLTLLHRLQLRLNRNPRSR
ncbi:unnamed protein product [Schistocephalus solidus]|uniref:Uncharacterized protein n=1 Tax=Schistocephalus solidus TaxID=70667 RepID=A0A183THD2_SCHSO|nr:unnamed protein product [Schistocephalus solidus]